MSRTRQKNSCTGSGCFFFESTSLLSLRVTEGHRAATTDEVVTELVAQEDGHQRRAERRAAEPGRRHAGCDEEADVKERLAAGHREEV